MLKVSFSIHLRQISVNLLLPVSNVQDIDLEKDPIMQFQDLAQALQSPRCPPRSSQVHRGRLIIIHVNRGEVQSQSFHYLARLTGRGQKPSAIPPLSEAHSALQMSTFSSQNLNVMEGIRGDGLDMNVLQASLIKGHDNSG